MIGINEAIGKQIELLRKKAKMTQLNLAQILNVSAQQIKRYENGDNAISLDNLSFLCEFFQITIDEFLFTVRCPSLVFNSYKNQAELTYFQNLFLTVSKIKSSVMRDMILDFASVLK
jgi:transcriptional regulator with XRE-family HTH domain